MKRWIHAAQDDAAVAQDIREKVSLAHKTNDTDVLRELADYYIATVRAAVVDATDDPELLAQLAKDTDRTVRRNVAQKIDDLNILIDLFHDYDASVSIAAGVRLSKMLAEDPKELRKALRKYHGDDKEAYQNDVKKIKRYTH